MPQVKKTSKPTAGSVQESKAFRDRLRDRYDATDYVRVINIDDEKFDWQYFPSAGEDTYFTDNGTVRVTEGRQSFVKAYSEVMPGNEQLWSIEAGDSEVLIGDNADLFIEGLYKKLVAKQRIHDQPNVSETQVRKFNWTDGLLQEQMIDKIFVGIERPNFDEPRGSKAPKEKQRA